MFRPIYLLLHYHGLHSEKISKYKKRWDTPAGKKFCNYIIDKIKKGERIDFKENPDLKSFLDNEEDLKGISISSLELILPKNNFIELYADFSYASFINCKFCNVIFGDTLLDFSYFNDCEFKNCTFFASVFYGVNFKNVIFKKCSFLDFSYFENCKLEICEFDNFFVDENNLFIDCYFNANTQIKNVSFKPNDNVLFQDKIILRELGYKYKGDIIKYEKMMKNNLPNIYKSVKESYLAGQVFDKYREYLFKQKDAETKYIKKGVSKIMSYFLKYVTGYGVKPLYTIISMLVVVLVFTLIFAANFNLSRSLLLSLSAFATVGNIPEISPYNFVYILESSLGICFFTLLVTILANIWFSEK